MAKRTSTQQSRSELLKAAQAIMLGQKEAASLVPRTIFLNLFKHNSAVSTQRDMNRDGGSRSTSVGGTGEPFLVQWRSGERSRAAGHQVDIEFVVSIVDATLSTKIRVDDAHTLDPFPSIKLGTGYVKELRALLEQHFNCLSEGRRGTRRRRHKGQVARERKAKGEEVTSLDTSISPHAEFLAANQTASSLEWSGIKF